MTKGPVMFTADCLDADDLSGTSLTYAWEHGSNAIEGAGGMGPQASAYRWTSGQSTSVRIT